MTINGFEKNTNKFFILSIAFIFFIFSNKTFGQKTKIRGFVDVSTFYQDDKLNFGFGEYDLFITSELSDRISFLGETVFKYDPSSSTKFSIGVERVIVSYNYKGNNNLLFGKQHTPINLWNDTYHHGRVFFPTIGRPLLFAAHIIPIHTMGFALQGQNLGKLKFGYNFMVGNGIGSNEITDNDKYKSITAAIHFVPIERMKIGVSFYNDIISEGVELFGTVIDEKVKQQLYTGSVSYFGNKFEVLAEGTLVNNSTDSEGSVQSFASYLYAGIIIKEKWVPYFRVDFLNYQNGDPYLGNNDTKAILAGLRYELSYLMVLKLEYQYKDRDITGIENKIIVQFAIGF
jgi:hypothetical protein